MKVMATRAVRTSRAIYQPGEVFEADPVKARPFLEQGILKPAPRVPGIAGLLGMPLSAFAKAGLLIRVKCRILRDEEVYFASSEKEAAIGRAEGLVCYTASELIELARLNPGEDDLRTLHEAKRVLGGRLAQPEDGV